MPIPIFDQVIYGDTSGVLGRGEVGGDQSILLDSAQSLTLIGDAQSLVANAVGGNDLLTDNNLNSTSILGDALSLNDQAHGGDDRILATARLEASASGDGLTLSGHATGGDDLIALEGRVTLAVGDAETMSGHARGGDDRIDVLAAQHSASYGDALLMTDQARGGDDFLRANVGADTTSLVGDAETMEGHSVGGNDTLTTVFVRPSDIVYHVQLYGDAVHLTGHAQGGADSLQGTSAFDSVLYGDGLELLDHASGGDDTLSSANGSDTMWGDAAVVGPQARTGADLFILSIGGHDQIMDFQPGQDRIDLAAFGFNTFQNLAGHLQPTSEGTLISVDANDDLLIRGVAPSQLGAGDFLFA